MFQKPLVTNAFQVLIHYSIGYLKVEGSAAIDLCPWCKKPFYRNVYAVPIVEGHGTEIGVVVGLHEAFPFTLARYAVL